MEEDLDENAHRRRADRRGAEGRALRDRRLRHRAGPRELLGYNKVARLLQQTLNEEDGRRQEADAARRERHQRRSGPGVARSRYRRLVGFRRSATGSRYGIGRARRLRDGSYLRISAKKSIARGSLDCPSQNIACLRTAGLRVRARDLDEERHAFVLRELAQGEDRLLLHVGIGILLDALGDGAGRLATRPSARARRWPRRGSAGRRACARPESAPARRCRP